MQDMVNLHAAKNVLLGKLGPHFTLLDPTKEVGHQFQPVCGYYSLSEETFPSCWVAAKFSPVSNPDPHLNLQVLYTTKTFNLHVACSEDFNLALTALNAFKLACSEDFNLTHST